jgi:O-methyltransferase/aklanonic acid methyltransferase
VSDAERWKHIDAASYDAAAERFDALAERYSGPVADALLETAAPKPGERVLDLGAGSGLVALRAARAGAVVEARDH